MQKARGCKMSAFDSFIVTDCAKLQGKLKMMLQYIHELLVA